MLLQVLLGNLDIVRKQDQCRCGRASGSCLWVCDGVIPYILIESCGEISGVAESVETVLSPSDHQRGFPRSVCVCVGLCPEIRRPGDSPIFDRSLDHVYRDAAAYLDRCSWPRFAGVPLESSKNGLRNVFREDVPWIITHAQFIHCKRSYKAMKILE